jgi:trans-2-enoyl-CoA reductase
MFNEHGPPERVLRLNEEETQPSPGPQECALRLLAAAINPADLNTIQGTYGSKPYLPCIPGNEGVFEVLKVGENVSDFKEGDRVIRKYFDVNNGTWQTNPVFPQEHLHKIPCDIPIALAAAMMINPPSAYLMLKDFVQLQEGMN